MKQSFIRLSSIVAFICFIGIYSSVAQIPSGYYNSAENLKGASLKTALMNIIDGHSDKGYDGLWNIYKDSDDNNGKVWDMYSTCNWTHGNKQCGNYKKVCDCINREHVIPQSWFNSRRPMVSDAHNVTPTDGKVNGQRSSYPHGETNSLQSEGTNALGGKGPSSYPGYSGTIFEPDDQYKGDIARIYFYFVTRYQSQMSGFNTGGALGANSYPSLAPWFKNLMLQWHRQDPVSQREIDRNNGIYKHQRNRNPYIDYPALAEHVWGNKTNQNWHSSATDSTPIIFEPSIGTVLDFEGTPVNTSLSDRIIVKAGFLTSDLMVSISGTDANAFTTPNSSLSKADAVSNNGASILITYTPATLKKHQATITISGGGLDYDVTISLKGEGTNDFKAVDASNCSPTSFQANWSTDFGATDYILNVFSYEKNTEQRDTTIFATSFVNGEYNDGVSKTSGYANFEDQALRMASGSSGCELTLPSIDLSLSDLMFTVNAKQYNKDSNPKIYVKVDGANAGEILTTSSMSEHSIPLNGNYSANSTITLEVNPKNRVFLQDITIGCKGPSISEIALDGYPQNVGNVLNHIVTVPNFDNQYYYNVTSIDGSEATTNTIKVIYNETSDNENISKDNIVYYNSQNTVVIEGLQEESTVNVYSISGNLISSHVASNSITIPMDNCGAGIYIFKVISYSSSQTFKVIAQ